jgi:hypothetical protein
LALWQKERANGGRATDESTGDPISGMRICLTRLLIAFRAGPYFIQMTLAQNNLDSAR